MTPKIPITGVITRKEQVIGCLRLGITNEEIRKINIATRCVRKQNYNQMRGLPPCESYRRDLDLDSFVDDAIFEVLSEKDQLKRIG